MQDSNSRKSLSIGKLAQAMGRLFRDNAGNTIAIVAAALIPITAMIGSGVDISRAYMAKSRMQSACDAASLAARRVMKNDDLNENVTDTGTEFFNFNFPQGLYETANFTPAITKPDAGLISITAQTTIPTTVMGLFGFDNLPLSVSCEASLNFVNTDVVLVLDVTGSMLCEPGETSCSGVTDVEPDSKMQGLRDAVMALYDELAPVQAQLTAQGLRLRYGVVPYSGTVNVGRLIAAEDSSYITNSTPYQSRVATYETTTGDSRTTETRNNISSANCDIYAVNRSYPTLDGAGPFVISGTPGTGTFVTRTYSKRDYSSSNDRCRRYVTTTTTEYNKFTGWTYRQEELDTSTFKTVGGTITLATTAGTMPSSGTFDLQEMAASGSGMNPLTVTWNGCIEERQTVSSITAASGFTIPSGAYDLDINHIPDSDATRWRPMLKDAIFQRTAGSAPQNSGTALNAAAAWWACPGEASRLAERERDTFSDYIDSIPPVGGTYHDIGMIWGARLISTGGIFGDGCEEYNGMPCNRHIIFMTDGAQTAYCRDTYTAWGMESNDMRVTGAGSCPDQLARHQQRFKMICNATKNMNVSVWVVAFATGLDANLTSCASNASQAKTSTDSDELIEAFREIGNQIGALRLTE